MRSDAERERLRQTFDHAAGIYHRVRPDYPEALFDDLVALAGLAPGDRLLEVGCATGKATLPLARRGFRITCVELGAGLAAAARRNLAGFDVEVTEGRFEDWRPGEPVSLVFAATAWHWVDPAVRYERAWAALRPGGHLAWWAQEHVFPDGGDPFFREIQDVYDEIGEGMPDGGSWPRQGELPDERAGIEASGLFEVVGVRQYAWERVYSAEEYIGLLSTFSGHMAMESWQRDRLYGEIRRRLGQRPDRSVRRGWGTVLHVARRRERTLRGGRPPRRIAEIVMVMNGFGAGETAVTSWHRLARDDPDRGRGVGQRQDHRGRHARRAPALAFRRRGRVPHRRERGEDAGRDRADRPGPPAVAARHRGLDG